MQIQTHCFTKNLAQGSNNQFHSHIHKGIEEFKQITNKTFIIIQTKIKKL